MNDNEKYYQQLTRVFSDVTQGTIGTILIYSKQMYKDCKEIIL